MFEIVGSIIGTLVIFNLGVWVGRKYYDKYITFFHNMVTKVKELFTRKKNKINN